MGAPVPSLKSLAIMAAVALGVIVGYDHYKNTKAAK